MDFELEDSKANNHDSGKGSNPFFLKMSNQRIRKVSSMELFTKNSKARLE